MRVARFPAAFEKPHSFLEALPSGLAQKILHRRFAVQLIDIAMMPFIAGSIKVRHMCQKNCFVAAEAR